jgi:hypothetical protein
MELVKTARGYEINGFQIVRKSNGADKFFIRYRNTRLNEMATVYFQTLKSARAWAENKPGN